MDSKPLVSEYFAKLPSSPDAFPFFYRRLVGLRFPIEVAEILEMRYLCHHAIDQSGRDDREYEWDEFAASRMADMEHVGIQKPAHRERLSRLLLLLKDYYGLHKTGSAVAEDELRQGLADNRFAQERSRSYGKIAGIAAIVAALSSILLSPPAILMQGVAILFAYLSLDSFYGIAVLRREERRLAAQLSEVLRRRVRTVNWRAVVRQTGAILGYTTPMGGEAFRLEQEHELPDLIEVNGA
ncbi:MAG: hypothetical protein ACYCTF_05475 [Acidiferrobacter sp.]